MSWRRRRSGSAGLKKLFLYPGRAVANVAFLMLTQHSRSTYIRRVGRKFGCECRAADYDHLISYAGNLPNYSFLARSVAGISRSEFCSLSIVYPLSHFPRIADYVIIPLAELAARVQRALH